MRLAYRETIEHETRISLEKIIQKTPGLSFTELVNEVGLQNSVVVYHLRILEKNKVIRSVKTRGLRCYYSCKISALKVPISTAAKILEIIKTNPGTFQTAIANEIKESRQVVNYQVGQLIKAGKVWYRVDGRKALLFARDNI